MTFHTSILLALSALAAAQSGSCPEVWSKVASALQSEFDGCNDHARAAIRAPFHDCVTGSCDGSLILGGECSRSENAGLEDICNKLSEWADEYEVGTADMIQFAQAVAISVCPLGPQIRALVGRKDSSIPAPEGLVPSSHDSVDAILSRFASVGLSANDVVALVGAHTTGKQFFDDPAQAGASFDTSPSVWDVTFYGETLSGTAPYTLQSDKELSKDSRTSDEWTKFSISQSGWAASFVSAMNRFGVVGNDVDSLTDCSNMLPGASKVRREAMRAPIGDRAFHPKAKS
ncbi:ligninase LG6 precursor [Polyplosphaeria fusca]|uniref:Peroxidase n=1 Tax=Polyplosphaeria fusca TaxID=682080 RepID=A0A9P4QNX7_9PLEO|nr:ligninase LG6 precursor [Polyplosphaeria fusca]